MMVHIPAPLAIPVVIALATTTIVIGAPIPTFSQPRSTIALPILTTTGPVGATVGSIAPWTESREPEPRALGDTFWGAVSKAKSLAKNQCSLGACTRKNEKRTPSKNIVDSKTHAGDATDSDDDDEDDESIGWTVVSGPGSRSEAGLGDWEVVQRPQLQRQPAFVGQRSSQLNVDAGQRRSGTSSASPPRKPPRDFANHRKQHEQKKKKENEGEKEDLKSPSASSSSSSSSPSSIRPALTESVGTGHQIKEPQTYPAPTAVPERTLEVVIGKQGDAGRTNGILKKHHTLRVVLPERRPRETAVGR